MLETYKKLFCEAFEIESDEAETATPETLGTWDSLRHMNLIAALEDEFGVEFEPDDVMGLNSYNAGIELLKKYGVAP
ncbi:acyl carrier protein [Roseomonas sp. F4]